MSSILPPLGVIRVTNHPEFRAHPVRRQMQISPGVPRIRYRQNCMACCTSASRADTFSTASAGLGRLTAYLSMLSGNAQRVGSPRRTPRWEDVLSGHVSRSTRHVSTLTRVITLAACSCAAVPPVRLHHLEAARRRPVDARGRQRRRRRRPKPTPVASAPDAPIG